MPTNSCNQGRQKVRLLNKPCHADNNDDEGDDGDDDGGGGDDGDGGDDDDGDDVDDDDNGDDGNQLIYTESSIPRVMTGSLKFQEPFVSEDVEEFQFAEEITEGA